MADTQAVNVSTSGWPLGGGGPYTGQGGSASGAGRYPAGATVTLQFFPDPGWEVKAVIVSGGGLLEEVSAGNNASYTLVIPDPITTAAAIDVGVNFVQRYIPATLPPPPGSTPPPPPGGATPGSGTVSGMDWFAARAIAFGGKPIWRAAWNGARQITHELGIWWTLVSGIKTHVVQNYEFGRNDFLATDWQADAPVVPPPPPGGPPPPPPPGGPPPPPPPGGPPPPPPGGPPPPPPGGPPPPSWPGPPPPPPPPPPPGGGPSGLSGTISLTASLKTRGPGDGKTTNCWPKSGDHTDEQVTVNVNYNVTVTSKQNKPGAQLNWHAVIAADDGQDQPASASGVSSSGGQVTFTVEAKPGGTIKFTGTLYDSEGNQIDEQSGSVTMDPYCSSN